MNSDRQQGVPESSANPPPANSGPLNVLVVDDSAIVRQVLTAVLSEKRGFRVTVAADPLIAMDKMKRFRPDVILLDLEMPRMDGMTFLEKLMSQNPVPVVVCSGLTGPRTEAAIRALEIGAVDIITKPKIGIRGFLEESAVLLEDAVRAAATAQVNKFRRLRHHSSNYHTADAVIPRYCHWRVNRGHRGVAPSSRTNARNLPWHCRGPAHARGFHGGLRKAVEQHLWY
jgi:chemotaxis response regulator CheB